MKICDLHTHILPGVDDGAPTMEYALQMLGNAVASDVEMLAVTPHFNVSYGPEAVQGLQTRFARLQQAAKNLPVQLVLGAEVRMCEDRLRFECQTKLPTINGSRYLLTEFSTSTEADVFENVLQGLLDNGYIPLVAHPERYMAVCRDPRIVMPWLDMGCHLQITGRSVLGEYGKTIRQTATFLLKNDLVACVASDAHGINRRSNFLLDVCDHLAVQYSKQYAGCLLYENPVRICCDADL